MLIYHRTNVYLENGDGVIETNIYQDGDKLLIVEHDWDNGKEEEERFSIDSDLFYQANLSLVSGNPIDEQVEELLCESLYLTKDGLRCFIEEWFDRFWR